MLSRKTHHRALPHHQSEDMKILNISFSRVGIKPTTFCVYSQSHACAPAPRPASPIHFTQNLLLNKIQKLVSYTFSVYKFPVDSLIDSQELLSKSKVHTYIHTYTGKHGGITAYCLIILVFISDLV